MGILCPEVLCFSPREKFSHSYRMLLLLFTHSVVSDSLRPHGLQHARLPYPSPSPAAFSNLRPLNHWCHSTLSSVVPFSSCLQSFPILGSFPWVSSSYQVAKVLEFQPQYQSLQWIFRLISFRIDWFDLLVVQGTPKSLLQYHSSKALILRYSAFFMVQLPHSYMTTRKTIVLTIRTFVGKVMSLLFNTLSRFNL